MAPLLKPKVAKTRRFAPRINFWRGNSSSQVQPTASWRFFGVHGGFEMKQTGVSTLPLFAAWAACVTRAIWSLAKCRFASLASVAMTYVNNPIWRIVCC
jgi:hypothetical protein